MKIFVITEKYPGSRNLYSNDFTHQRNKIYLDKGHDVFVAIKHAEESNYQKDGAICRGCPKIEDIQEFISDTEPDVLGIHFYHKEHFKLIENFNGKVIIWIHGHEAINWYRRIYDYSPKRIIKHLPGLLWVLIERKLIWKKLVNLSNHNKNITFVFVSNWMKKVAERDNWITINNDKIIPNGIDTIRFNYVKKNKEDRFNVLSIRPYNSNKYANDITVKTILKFSKKECFKNFNFTLMGDGEYFEEITNKVKFFANVKIIRGFIPNNEIPALHKKYGLLLTPTRQDAQGVSMCEAMSSGLVPITSNNTAIPEFITDKTNGILCKNDPIDFANALELINDDPNLFLKMSFQANKSILKNCDSQIVAAQELKLFNLNK